MTDPLEAILTTVQLTAWRACRAPGEMPPTEFAAETERVKGTVGNHLSRAERKIADEHEAFLDAAEPVDFLIERDERTTSWRRAAPMADETRIERLNRFVWLVELPDGQPHVTALVRDEAWYDGWCDCDGFQYQEGPCAHLCTLRQGAFVHVRSADGDRLQVPDAEAAREPVTDGSHVVEQPPAGEDGRVFGRPEGRL